MQEGTALYLLCVMKTQPFGLFNDVPYTSYVEALKGLHYWQSIVEEPLGIAEFVYVTSYCLAEAGKTGLH